MNGSVVDPLGYLQRRARYRRVMRDLSEARRAWEAFAAVSAPEEIGLLDAWDADVEYVEDPRWPGAGSFRGQDAVGARFREYLEDLGAIPRLVVEHVRETPGGLVSLVRVSGSTPRGLPFDHLWAYRFRMREGRIVWFRAFVDPDEAMTAAED